MNKNKQRSASNQEIYSLPGPLWRDRNIAEAYSLMRREGTDKKLYMTVTTGRSGIKWLHGIFKAHENVTAGSERNPIEESFYRYVKHHGLAVDVSGVLHLTMRDIMKDWESCDVSVIGSPYFSHDFYEIYETLKPDRVIWGINDPRFTVQSFFNKGWYLYEEDYLDHTLACGMQSVVGSRWNRAFSRIVPRGDFYGEWCELTRVGKISWFLNSIHMEIWAAIQRIAKKDVWIFRLEEANQNYSYYQNFSKKFELTPSLSKADFLSLKKAASHEGENVEHDWSQIELSEFEHYSADLMQLYRGGVLNHPDYMSEMR